jgi:hypothetical protein
MADLLEHLVEVRHVLKSSGFRAAGDCITDAIAEIERLRKAADGVNVGAEMVLVPREPTPWMRAMGSDANLQADDEGRMAAIYRAMIAAAPQPASEVGVKVGVSASTETEKPKTSDALWLLG